MKTELTKKLLSICGTENSDLTYGIDNLTAKQLKEVEAELIKHFEFSKIVWMDYPSQLAEDKETLIIAQIYKLTESQDPKYTGKVGYIYKVLFTPVIYDPKTLHNPVKDGCIFAPTIYDPATFTPTQSITLTWSPEFSQDINAPERTYEDDKQMIRDLLEKVLDNPEEYRPEGFRNCMVRFAVV